jgi:predicted ester cyclase
MVGGYVTAFPDMTFDLQNMMAEGDKVSVMWTVSGTNTGPMGAVPATGKPIKMRGHVLCRFAGDKVAEEWELFDEALMMQQLGLAD